MLAERFEFGSDAAASKAVLLQRLEAVLFDRRSRGEITALVVDEAQSLSRELLEEIRLLANIETTTTKLLPLVLAGQPELAERLNDPSLRQLKQRIALRCTIKTFELQETAAYIASRVRVAGGDPVRLFTRDAVVEIHAHSRGIPRTVSVLCDNALMNGLALGRKPVGKDIVAEVCRDFEVGGTALVTAPEQLPTVHPTVAAVPADQDSPDVVEAGPEKPRGLFARAFQRR